MLRTAKMELLRVLVSERLSAVAQEIFNIVERTIVEYEEEMSKTVAERQFRLLDVVQSYNKDSPQVCASAVTQQPGQQLDPTNINVHFSKEPENTTELPEGHSSISNVHLHSSPASENPCECDEEMLIDVKGVVVKQEPDLDSPLEMHKVEKPFECDDETMVQQLKQHSDGKSSPYQCPVCRCRFCLRSEFVIHTRTHQSDKPNNHGNERESLLFHQKIKAEEKQNQCCSESAMKTFSLSLTAFVKSESDQDSLQPLSLYQIQAVTDMDKAAAPANHIKAEPVETHCGVSHTHRELSDSQARQSKHFNTESNPQRSLLEKSSKLVQFEAGTGQKPYKCPCCTKRFSLTKTLLRHLKIHKDDKQYQCQICGRNFGQKSGLVNHMRTHTGERPFQCPKCQRTFIQKGNLMVHMRKHTGEIECR